MGRHLFQLLRLFVVGVAGGGLMLLAPTIYLDDV